MSCRRLVVTCLRGWSWFRPRAVACLLVLRKYNNRRTIRVFRNFSIAKRMCSTTGKDNREFDYYSSDVSAILIKQHWPQHRFARLTSLFLVDTFVNRGFSQYRHYRSA